MTSRCPGSSIHPVASAGGRWRRRPKIDPERKYPVLDGGFSISNHGEVHEVGLSLLLEPLAIRSFNGGQATGSDRIGPGLEAFHHCVRVELIGHGPMVPAQPTRYEWRRPALHCMALVIGGHPGSFRDRGACHPWWGKELFP